MNLFEILVSFSASTVINLLTPWLLTNYSSDDVINCLFCGKNELMTKRKSGWSIFSHYNLFHLFYDRMKFFIKEYGTTSYLSEFLFESEYERDEKRYFLEKLILNCFTCWNKRGYIYYNEKKFVQSRIVLIDLSMFVGANKMDHLFHQLLDGVLNVDLLMDLHESANFSVNVDQPVLQMLKPSFLVDIEQWEESNTMVREGNSIGSNAWPSPLCMYGPISSLNAGLTPIEAWIVKTCYIPGSPVILESNDWYQEEGLLALHELPKPDDPDGKIQLRLGWFFNSINDFKGKLISALSCARKHFERHGLVDKELPLICGLYQEHVNHIKFAVPLMLDDEDMCSKVTILRNDGKERVAAIYGIDEINLRELLNKRLEYLRSAHLILNYCQRKGRRMSPHYMEMFCVSNALLQAQGNKEVHSPSAFLTRLDRNTNQIWLTNPTMRKRKPSTTVATHETNFRANAGARGRAYTNQRPRIGTETANGGLGFFKRDNLNESKRNGKWSLEESAAISSYINTYGTEKKWIDKLLTHERYGPILLSRSRQQIRDKSKSLEKVHGGNF